MSRGYLVTRCIGLGRSSFRCFRRHCGLASHSSRNAAKSVFLIFSWVTCILMAMKNSEWVINISSFNVMFIKIIWGKFKWKLNDQNWKLLGHELFRMSIKAQNCGTAIEINHQRTSKFVNSTFKTIRESVKFIQYLTISFSNWGFERNFDM